MAISSLLLKNEILILFQIVGNKQDLSDDICANAFVSFRQ